MFSVYKSFNLIFFKDTLKMKSGLYIYDFTNDLVFCSVSIHQCVLFFFLLQNIKDIKIAQINCWYIFGSLWPFFCIFCFNQTLLGNIYFFILIFLGGNNFFLTKTRCKHFLLYNKTKENHCWNYWRCVIIKWQKDYKIMINMYWCYEREEIAIGNKMLECKVKYLNYM